MNESENVQNLSTEQKIISGLRSQNMHDRDDALSAALKIENLSLNLFLILTKLISDTSVIRPNTGIQTPGSAVFEYAIGQKVTAVIGSIGKRHPEQIYFIIKNINEYNIQDRLIILDGIAAFGVPALISMINHNEAAKQEIIDLFKEILLKRKDKNRVCRVIIKLLGEIGREAKNATSEIITFLKYIPSDTNSNVFNGYHWLGIGLGSNLSSLEIKHEAYNAILKIGKDAIPYLVEHLDNFNDEDDNDMLFNLFTEFGEESIPSLIELSEKANEQLRHYARLSIIQIVKWMGKEKASESIINALIRTYYDDPHEFTRKNALKEIIKIAKVIDTLRSCDDLKNLFVKAYNNEKGWLLRRRIKKTLKKLDFSI
jgi:hypothetical protein